ncbi:hypothetical protein BJY59DRAFT_458786 [Rhodotorula toruloides]
MGRLRRLTTALRRGTGSNTSRRPNRQLPACARPSSSTTVMNSCCDASLSSISTARTTTSHSVTSARGLNSGHPTICYAASSATATQPSIRISTLLALFSIPWELTSGSSVVKGSERFAGSNQGRLLHLYGCP